MRIKSAKTVLLRIFFLLLTVFLLSVGSVNAQTCDPNPACDPTSGTCCPNQCDPNPACVASDPNAMPCCNAGDNMSPGGPGGHMGSCPEGPGYDACIAAQSSASATQHHPGDTCMQHPAGPARDACYSNQPGPGGPNDHHDGPGDGPCPPNCGPGPNDHHDGPGDGP